MDQKLLGDQYSQSPDKASPFTDGYSDFYSFESPFSAFKTPAGTNTNLSPQLQSKTQNSSLSPRIVSFQKSAPKNLRKIIPPPPGFEWTQDNGTGDKNIQSDLKIDSPTLKLMQPRESYQSVEELSNELEIYKRKLARAEKDVEKYKNSYYTVLQLQDTNSDSRFDKQFQSFKADERFYECKTCREIQQENFALHERIAKFSAENSKVLTSFYGLFTQFQAIQIENREILGKYKAAIEGKPIAFNCTAERYCNTAKGYKDQLIAMQKELDDIKKSPNSFKNPARSYGLDDKVSQESNSPEIRTSFKKDRSDSIKHVAINECQECLLKHSRLVEKDKIIKELRDSLNSPLLRSQSLDLYSTNKDFQMLKEHIWHKISFIRNLLGEPTQIALPGQKALIGLLESREILEKWWNQRSNFPQESEWIKEGQQIISQACAFAKDTLEVKPMIKGRPGRELRMSVHKQVIEIEQAFNNVSSISPEIEEIKRMFLELPYLLKPIFDLMKEYEQQNAGVELSPDLKLESVISELKILQDSLSDQPSKMEGNEQFAPIVRRNSKRHRTNA